MIAPGNLFEVVSASLVGADQPRFWVTTPAEAEALISGACLVFTVGDLHAFPAERGERWAIVRAPVLVGDITLAAESGELLATVGKMSAAPFSVETDRGAGLLTVNLVSETPSGIEVVATLHGEDSAPPSCARNARGLSALRNRAPELLTRALAEVDRLRAELRTRGGR